MLSTGFCCSPCRQRGLLEYESSTLIAIDVNCWLDVHVSNLHEPVGAGEERELITIFYSPQKSLSLSNTAATMKRKRQKIVWLKPWNPSTKTLEPQNLPVAIKPILSILYSSRLLPTHTRSRNQNSTIHITLLLQLNAAQKRLVHYFTWSKWWFGCWLTK